MSPITHLNEKIFFNELVMASIGKSSALIDTFSGWVVAGFAGAVAFSLSNVSSINSISPPEVTRFALGSLAVVVVAGILEKFLAVLLGGACAGSAVAKENKEELLAAEAMDFDFIFRETEKSFLPPFRFMARWSFGAIRDGDLTASTRLFVKIAQVQGCIAFLQASILACVIVRLALRAHL